MQIILHIYEVSCTVNRWAQIAFCTILWASELDPAFSITRRDPITLTVTQFIDSPRACMKIFELSRRNSVFDKLLCWKDLSQTKLYVLFQMELDSKDLTIDRLNSQIKQHALNTSITENDDLSVPPGNTLSWVVQAFVKWILIITQICFHKYAGKCCVKS